MKLENRKEMELKQKAKKQSFKKPINKKQKGITLIALVITIIVLLILAGVSIATLTGDNGILTKAQTAKTETEKASEEEQIQLAAMNAAMNTEKYEYEVKDGTVPIPAGFAPTQIEGENTIAEGVVVVDENGNEFVWIPVTDKYERILSMVSEVEQYITDETDYLPDGIVINDEKEVEKEKEIVENAGGFYIGRYETGAEGGNLQEDEKDGETTVYSWTENTKLVCKKGATVYNWIDQKDAKMKSKTFINNNDVKSGLITGIQWDAVMAFVNNKKDGNGKVFNITKADETRHIKKTTTSGQNESDRVCNIYDLEGNYYEYTAERLINSAEQDDMAYYRGGNHWNNFSALTRGNRSSSKGADPAHEGTGFRLVLYIL